MKSKIFSKTLFFLKNQKDKFTFKNVKIFFVCSFIYLSLTAFIFSFNNYYAIWKNNISLIFFLSPFLLLALAWFIGTRKKELVVASCAIIVTALFFIYERGQTEIAGINSIQATNIHNCRIIQNNINILTGDENKNQEFVLNYFVTEPYYQNFDLIYRKAGQEESKKIQRAIFEMEGVNSFVKMNIERASSLGNVSQRYNDEIIKWSNKIKPIICKKLFYENDEVK
ncbi:hypothetical protein HQ544_00650 [Candidatus Falkowbacteria bacterium]|nr:hypothetical protein [Candidatus Falkowbacteria bacterium]